MQGRAHAAKSKEEEQPAAPTVPYKVEPQPKAGETRPVRRKPQAKPEQKPEEKKKPREEEVMAGIEERNAMRSEFFKAISFLKGRSKPDTLDDLYIDLKGILPDEDFLHFKKGATVFSIPPEGTPESLIFWDAYNKNQEQVAQWNEQERKEAKGEAIEESKRVPPPPFIQFGPIDEETGTVVIRNTLYMPPELQKIADSVAEDMMRILASGDWERIARAWGAYNKMRENLVNYAQNYAAQWGESHYQGELSNFDLQATRRSALMKGADLNFKAADLAEEAYGFCIDVALECAGQISSLAKGEGVTQKSQDNIARAEYWRDKKEEKLQLARIEVLHHVLTGADAIERIKGGIAMGVYSSPEIAFYEKVSKDLEAIRAKMRERAEKYGKLSEKQLEQQKLDAAQALECVRVLELIATKTDLAFYTENLLFKGPQAQMSYQGKMHQRAHLSKEAEFERLSARAVFYCDMLKNYINGMGLLEEEDKRELFKGIDSAASAIKKAKTIEQLPKPFEELKGIGKTAALMLSERYEESRAENPDNPWDVRAFAYAKMYLDRYGVPFIAATTAIGAGIGALGGPGGVGGGAATGFEVGSMVVGGVAVFMSVDAIVRYLSSEGFEAEQALQDLRTGAVLALFAAGGGPLKAIAKPLSATVLATTATSSIILLQDDIRSGDPSKYLNIPSDVAFIAIGGMGFVRTFAGGFRPLNLGKGASNIFAVADSAGLASTKLSDRISAALAKPLEIGYSPKWFAFNVIFGGATDGGDILDALKHGRVNLALSSLGKGFTEVTGAMVGFDFVLRGVGAAGRAGVGALGRGMAEAGYPGIAREMEFQTFRIRVPKEEAKFVAFLHEYGLFNRVSEIAGPLNAEQSARLLEITYGSGGKASAEYVQAALGLEGPGAFVKAKKIARLVAKTWDNSRAGFARKEAAAKFWKGAGEEIEKNRKLMRATALAKKHGVEVVAVGAIATYEFAAAPDIAMKKELVRTLTESEGNFVSMLMATDLGWAGMSRFNREELFDAASEAFALAKEVAGKKYLTLPSRWESEKDAKRFMLAAACALLMNGRPAKREDILFLAGKLHDALEDAGIKSTKDMPVDGLALLASLVLAGKEGDFVQDFQEIASTTVKENEPVLFNYAISIYYYAAISGKEPDWARDASISIFNPMLERGGSQFYSAIEIVHMASGLYGGELSDANIFQKADSADLWLNIILGQIPQE